MIKKFFLFLSIAFPLFILFWYFKAGTVIFFTDCFYFLFIEATLVFLTVVAENELYIDVGKRVFQNKLSLFCFIITLLYGMIALFDSFHYQLKITKENGELSLDKDGRQIFSNTRSVLDTIVVKLYKGVEEKNFNVTSITEKRYSAPFAKQAYDLKYEVNPKTKKMEATRENLQKPGVHILGTDRSGGDVFYKVLKGTRTAIIVGLVTTLILVPFAMAFGISAGYFGGIVDDVIQFIYTTISSIPGILLIASLILIMKNVLNPTTNEAIQRQDETLLLGLCLILGLLGWSGLCRLLRAETLKLKELDFIQAAKALGTSHFNIILKHITPNVAHIILISFILHFSGLVMVETILSYLKIGVPTTIYSWGRIIEEARNELSRDPIVYWPLLGSFIAMFTLILCVNLLGDVIRDALDPKLRKG